MKEVIEEGKNKDEALRAALEKLNAMPDDVNVEILEAPREGFLGFLGSRNYKIKVTLKEPAAPAADGDFDPHNSISAPAYLPSDSQEIPVNDETPEEWVREFIETVFKHISVECELEINEGENNIFVEISGKDAGVVIGKFGQTLDSLQFLTNVILSKKYGNKKKILINVGDYRERRETSITRLAKSAARKVMKTRKPETLAPMPPHDRRTVHLALSTFKHIQTASDGTGKNRRVIISFKD
jgi:spoIIIJ-associated protein